MFSLTFHDGAHYSLISLTNRVYANRTMCDVCATETSSGGRYEFKFVHFLRTNNQFAMSRK